jgi:hypothetical protein
MDGQLHFRQNGFGHIMRALSNSGTSRGCRPIISAPEAAPCSKIDWHDARSEYDQSVADLLAAIKQCSTLPLSDAEKCVLIEAARELSKRFLPNTNECWRPVKRLSIAPLGSEMFPFGAFPRSNQVRLQPVQLDFTPDLLT